MTPFKNILVLSERNRIPFERGVSLAKDLKARLTLIQWLKATSARQQRPGGQRPPDRRESAAEQPHRQLAEDVLNAEAEGLEVQSETAIDASPSQIVHKILQHEPDLIIADAGKLTLKERFVKGSRLQLICTPHCPVLLTKAAARGRFRNILVALDPDRFDIVRDSLNMAIMEVARALVLDDDSEVHVVHAWQLVAEMALRSRAGVSESKIHELLGSEVSRRARTVDALVQMYPLRGIRLHLVKGTRNESYPLWLGTRA